MVDDVSGQGPARPSPTGPPPVRYIGLVTRAIAFAIDATVINLVATIVGLGAALILSVLHVPKKEHTLLGVIGAGAFVVWCIGYFVVFWVTTGQTFGARAMCFRVVAVKGERLKPRRALLRCIGLVLAALPLFAGYLIILVDRKRRGFQDYLARTVVIDAPQTGVIAQRRAAQRETVSGEVVVEHSSNSGDDRVLALPQASG
jgi:uncharacterized RDD family membrane protein YckC